MNDKTPKQISRRDAIKILGAVAGASVLANLPSKWNKPELTTGVLPAHAQTSVVAPPAPTTHTLVAGADDPNANFCDSLPSTVTITPPTPGIVMHYVIALAGTPPILLSPASPGTATTVAGGVASLSIAIKNDAIDDFNVDDTVTVTWTFENASDGSGSDSQVFTTQVDGC